MRAWQRFDDHARQYDQYRPEPPSSFIELLLDRARITQPPCVVDIGCGTGLSTRIWSRAAERVVGVDASRAMLSEARARADTAHEHYVACNAAAIGLRDDCADIVTCCQAFHWMEPRSTLREVSRILRRGGVFAALDFDYPPSVHPALDAELVECMRRIQQDTTLQMPTIESPRWEKSGHLQRLDECGCFASTEETVLMSQTSGDADDIIALVTTISYVALALKLAPKPTMEVIRELRDRAHVLLGEADADWQWTCRVRLAIKAQV